MRIPGREPPLYCVRLKTSFPTRNYRLSCTANGPRYNAVFIYARVQNMGMTIKDERREWNVRGRNYRKKQQ